MAELWSKRPQLSRPRPGKAQQAQDPLNPQGQTYLIGQPVELRWKPPACGQQLPKPFERESLPLVRNFRLCKGQD